MYTNPPSGGEHHVSVQYSLGYDRICEKTAAFSVAVTLNPECEQQSASRVIGLVCKTVFKAPRTVSPPTSAYIVPASTYFVLTLAVAPHSWFNLLEYAFEMEIGRFGLVFKMFLIRVFFFLSLCYYQMIVYCWHHRAVISSSLFRVCSWMWSSSDKNQPFQIWGPLEKSWLTSPGWGWGAISSRYCCIAVLLSVCLLW